MTCLQTKTWRCWAPSCPRTSGVPNNCASCVSLRVAWHCWPRARAFFTLSAGWSCPACSSSIHGRLCWPSMLRGRRTSACQWSAHPCCLCCRCCRRESLTWWTTRPCPPMWWNQLWSWQKVLQVSVRYSVAMCVCRGGGGWLSQSLFVCMNWVDVCVWLCICLCTCMCVCVHVCIYVCTCTHVCSLLFCLSTMSQLYVLVRNGSDRAFVFFVTIRKSNHETIS